jgi:myo-inositol-1(or 4)-monophosphatase
MIDKIIEIVYECSRFFKESFAVESKGSASNFVTSADRSVQQYLKEKLVPLISNSGFIGEESSDNDYNNTYLWIVDPIDGTANFIRDIGYSAVSVGLMKDGQPILGVVYNPYRDEMFYAEKGKGAYLNGNRITVSDRDLKHSILCTAMSLYNKDYAKPCFNIIEKVYDQCDDIRRLGSAALELVYLACGRVDLYFEIRVFPWDIAGAAMIFMEAGGYFGTIGFSNLVYDRPIPLICANTIENYEYLRKIVLDEIPEIPYDK